MSDFRELKNSEIDTLIKSICIQFNQKSNNIYYPMDCLFSERMFNFKYKEVQLEQIFNKKNISNDKMVDYIYSVGNDNKIDPQNCTIINEEISLQESILNRTKSAFESICEAKKQKENSNTSIYLICPVLVELERSNDLMNKISKKTTNVNSDKKVNHFILMIIDPINKIFYFMDSMNIQYILDLWTIIMNDWLECDKFKELFSKSEQEWTRISFDDNTIHQQSNCLCSFYILLYTTLFCKGINIDDIMNNKNCNDEYVQRIFCKKVINQIDNPVK